MGKEIAVDSTTLAAAAVMDKTIPRKKTKPASVVLAVGRLDGGYCAACVAGEGWDAWEWALAGDAGAPLTGSPLDATPSVAAVAAV